MNKRTQKSAQTSCHFQCRETLEILHRMNEYLCYVHSALNLQTLDYSAMSSIADRVSVINSSGNRAYYYAELAVSSLGVAVTIASTQSKAHTLFPVTY